MTDPSRIEPVGPVHYPESDGEPMGETDRHIDEMIALREALKGRYEDVEDVYVAGNVLLYYEEGNPASRFSPDVLVTFGIPKGPRRVYKVWEEGKAPDFVLEISSKSTWTVDEGNKKALCRRLGVREYFLFDPEGEYLDPRLQGYRLSDGEWERITPEPDGAIRTDVLGLRFTVEGDRLRATDARTGERLLRPEELRQEVQELRQRLAKLGRDRGSD